MRKKMKPLFDNHARIACRNGLELLGESAD